MAVGLKHRWKKMKNSKLKEKKKSGKKWKVENSLKTNSLFKLRERRYSRYTWNWESWWDLAEERERERQWMRAGVVWFTSSQALLAVAVLSGSGDRELWGLSLSLLLFLLTTLYNAQKKRKNEKRKKRKKKSLESLHMDCVIFWWVMMGHSPFPKSP